MNEACKEFSPRLSGYHDGALSAEEAKRIEDHLASCPSCRETLESYALGDRLIASATPDLSESEWEALALRVETAVARDAARPAVAVPAPSRGRTFWQSLTPRHLAWGSFGAVAAAAIVFLLYPVTEVTLREGPRRQLVEHPTISSEEGVSREPASSGSGEAPEAVSPPVSSPPAGETGERVRGSNAKIVPTDPEGAFQGTFRILAQEGPSRPEIGLERSPTPDPVELPPSRVPEDLREKKFVLSAREFPASEPSLQVIVDPEGANSQELELREIEPGLEVQGIDLSAVGGEAVVINLSAESPLTEIATWYAEACGESPRKLPVARTYGFQAETPQASMKSDTFALRERGRVKVASPAPAPLLDDALAFARRGIAGGQPGEGRKGLVLLAREFPGNMVREEAWNDLLEFDTREALASERPEKILPVARSADEFVEEYPESGTASGARIRQVRLWARLARLDPAAYCAPAAERIQKWEARPDGGQEGMREVVREFRKDCPE